MAKSGRHKKLRKQEKAKTQLTGVKKLSKAKNVVEPTLRVKKILIREQLKSSLSSGTAGGGDGSSQYSVSGIDDEGATSRRKQTVQDLLSNANHHNVTTRKDAIIGLQEIATTQITAITRNLDKVLAKIGSLTSDQESVIRKENSKFAQCLFSKIAENQMRPFWSMLVTHLRCTMTHLIPAVRHDALNFIEILIDHFPALVMEASAVMLPSVLGLITTIHNDEHGPGSKKHKPVARLKVEISNSHSNIKERLAVFRLLSRCFSLESGDIHSAAKALQSDAAEYLGITYPFGYVWDQARDTELRERHPFLRNAGLCKNRPYAMIVADPYSDSFSSLTSQAANSWQDFVVSCFAVLIETWVELRPSTLNNRSDEVKGKKRKLIMSEHDEADADNDANFCRRNGYHNLNDTSLDSLLSIVTLIQQLLHPGDNTQSGSVTSYATGFRDEAEFSAQRIPKSHVLNLEKYFLHLMPYVALQESRKKDVVTINLKLFLIAAKLRILNSSMKRKFRIFIEDVMNSSVIEKQHCRWILDIMSLLADHDLQRLSTNFLTYASKVGHFTVAAEYLRDLLRPANQFTENKCVQVLISSVGWDEVLTNLIEYWTPTSNNTEVLLELLTFVGLRRLTRLNSILITGKLKELVKLSTNPNMWCAAYRIFVYADCADIFRKDFESVCPSNFSEMYTK